MTPSRRALKRAAAIVLVAVALLVPAAPPAVAATVAYPTQSIGSRGTDVTTIQLLLRQRGFAQPVTGYFGSVTRGYVRAFQRRLGLAPDGVVGPITWSRLATPVRYGSRGDAVRAVQLVLNEKVAARLAVDGAFGSLTRAAVVDFQRLHGLAPDGVVGPITWRYLAWHYERPNFRMASACAYATGANGHRAHWGTAGLIAQLERAANAVYRAGYGPVAIGDVSAEAGGPLAGHRTHQVGLDADIRPMRTANNQCSYGVTWYRWSGGRKVCCNPAYDRAATRTLVRTLRAVSGGHLDAVAFNDPQLIAEGLTIYLAGHDDHLHATYCEVGHRDYRYRCGR